MAHVGNRSASSRDLTARRGREQHRPWLTSGPARLSGLLAALTAAGILLTATVVPAPKANAASFMEPTGGTLALINGTTPALPGVTQVSGGLASVRFTDGTVGHAYGLDVDRELTFHVAYSEADWDDSVVPTGVLSTVAYIVSSFGPAQGNVSESEVMAVQAAIWHFTDQFTLDPAANPPAVVSLYDTIVAAASDPANTLAQPPPSLAFTPAQASGAEGQMIAFTVTGSGWTAPVELNVTGTNPGGSGEIVSCRGRHHADHPGHDVGLAGLRQAHGRSRQRRGHRRVARVGRRRPGGGRTGVRRARHGRRPSAVGAASSVTTSAEANAQAVFQTTRGNLTVEKLIAGTPGPGETYTIEIRQGSTVIASHEFPDGDAGAAAFQHVFVDLLAGTYSVVELPGTPGRPNTAATVEITGGGVVTFGPGEHPRVVVTNRYEGRLRIGATVTGGPAAGRFAADVSCSLGAALVYAVTGIPLDPSAPFVSEPLPAGSSCIVAESATGGAESVSITPPPPTGLGPYETIIEIVNGQTADVGFEHRFPPGGTLRVTMAVSGPVTGPFALTVSCTSAGRTVATGAEQGVPFDADHPWQSGQLPAGARCVVTQTISGNAEAVSVVPPGTTDAQGRATTTVVVPIASTVGATFTNARAAAPARFGGLSIVTATTGGPGTGPFTFTMSCGGVVLGAGDATFMTDTDPANLIADRHVVSSPLPDGTACTITQTDRAGARATSISVDGAALLEFSAEVTPVATVTVSALVMRTITVTNVMPDTTVAPSAQAPASSPGSDGDTGRRLAFTGDESHGEGSLAVGLAAAGWALLVLAGNVRRRTSVPAGLG